MIDLQLLEKAQKTALVAAASGLRVATAESCTGGMVSALLTTVAGSSAWFECAFVTYSNEAKKSMLGVSPATLAAYGAVSVETAREMAAGAIKRSHADCAVSITGIAGPSGAVPGKPVGTVCFGLALKRNVADDLSVLTDTKLFEGDRESVRRESALYAMELLEKALKGVATAI